MKLEDRDYPLVDAFFKREAEDFNWAPEDNGRGKQAYIDKLHTLLKEKLDPIEKADHVVLESLTNMGLVDRSLTLTPHEYNFNVLVTVSMPPNPRNGGMGVSIKDRFTKT